MADERKIPATPSLDALKRMGAATRFFEDQYREEPLPKGKGPRPVASLLRAAKSTSTITAASGDTPGSGTIEYYDVPESGAATATGITDTCRNWGGSIASNRMLLVGTGPWGPWVVVDKCG